MRVTFRLRNAIVAWWLPASILGAWEGAAWLRLLNPLFFPAPSAILAAGWNMARSGEWMTELLSTLQRMFQGAGLGVCAGFALGLLMGVSAPLRTSFEPAVSVLNSTPKLALMPLLLLIVGVGETARLVPIFLTGFVTLSMQTLDAVRGVDYAYVEMARNYGARSRDLMWRVYLPACSPQVFTGLRLAAGRALVITISVELLGAPDGLGRVIWMAWQTLATEKLYIGIFTTSLLGLAFHQGLAYLERLAAPWAAAKARGQTG